MSELADETDSKSVIRKGVWVRVPPPAPACIDKKDADKNPALQCGIFAYKIKKLKAIKNNFLTFEKSGGVK